MLFSYRLPFLCVVIIEAIAFFCSTWMPPTAHMMGLALLAVWLGCHASLEQEVVDEVQPALGKSEALLFPVIAGTGLTVLYLAFKFADAATVNLVMRSYFVLMGITVIGDMFRPLLPGKWVTKLESKTLVHMEVRKIPLINTEFGFRLTLLDLVLYSVGLSLALWYGITKHWIGNNIMGLAFCISGLARFAIGDFSTCALMSLGLLVYDVVMVFYSPMMIAVATKLDAPIKFLFPLGDIDQWGKPGFSLLGLGDIVVPGILLALLLRMDATKFLRSSSGAALVKTNHSSAASVVPATATGNDGNDGSKHALAKISTAATLLHTPFPKPYFMFAWAAYSVGLAVTCIILHVFNHGQPALFYLVPATLLSAVAVPLVKGEWKFFWSFKDDNYLAQIDEADGNGVAPAAGAGTSSDGGAAGKAEGKKNL
jgi:minor histocompatibility antigen H13